MTGAITFDNNFQSLICAVKSLISQSFPQQMCFMVD